MSSITWFPVLESNQGVLSLGALVLALALALWEQRQLRLQRSKERAAEIQDAITLIDELENTLNPDGLEEADGLRLDVDPEELDMYVGALRTLAAAHAKTPLLALALFRAARTAEELANSEEEEVVGHHADMLIEALHKAKADAEDALERGRERVVIRKATEREVGKMINKLLAYHKRKSAAAQ